MQEMRQITRERVEANQYLLEKYRKKGIPLTFIAYFTGNDSIDMWQGLNDLGRKFLVSTDLHSERNSALLKIEDNAKKGCILDAITLSIVRRLGIKKAVSSVCGPIYTTQSIINLFKFRLTLAEQNLGKKMGFMTWQDNKLIYTEYSQEMLKKIAKERKEELKWVKENVAIVPTLPKNDLPKEVKRIMNLIDNEVSDPAIASEGKNILLLSEDFGFRIWSESNFNISSTWLQPVLMSALNNNFIKIDKYREVINSLVLMGHTYISLDSNCLMPFGYKRIKVITQYSWWSNS